MRLIQNQCDFGAAKAEKNGTFIVLCSLCSGFKNYSQKFEWLFVILLKQFLNHPTEPTGISFGYFIWVFLISQHSIFIKQDHIQNLPQGKEKQQFKCFRTKRTLMVYL